MKRLVIFTGAGISADSGICTFRDQDGLWANHRIEDVCTPEASLRNRELVIEFYNMRRKELLTSSPNEAHIALAQLEQHFHVEVITQNIDDLHERAGSTHITHLHGELRKLRSSRNEEALVSIDGWKQDLDARHEDGSLLRPHVVFFGESVPMYDVAVRIVQSADIFVVVGTSLAVYPAAMLVRYVRPHVPVFVVDPGKPDLSLLGRDVECVVERAAVGVPQLATQLIERYSHV